MEITFPSHPESERALIGICLFNGSDSIEEVLTMANIKGLFYDERHGEIWARMERLHKQGRPIDIRLIAKEKVFADVALDYVSEVANESAPASSLPQYLSIATEYQKRRAVIRLAVELAGKAQETANKIDEAIEAAETEMFSLQAVASDDKSIKGGIRRVLDGWEYAHAHQGQLTGIASGLHDLDQLTNGFQPEHLIVIGARPSQGKTALLGTIAAHCALKNNLPTLFFSLESSMEEILRRMMCCTERLNGSRLRAGDLQEGDMPKIMRGGSALNKSPLRIEDRGSLTIAQMRSIARRQVKKHGIRVIMVDYLQKVKPSAKSEKRTYEVGQVSEGLKEMAKELKVPVIAACQLNRESDKDKGRWPKISDLGDSGMIERDADMIAMLYKDQHEEGAETWPYKLIVGKHRDGDCKVIPLQFFPSFTKFESQSKF